MLLASPASVTSEAQPQVGHRDEMPRLSATVSGKGQENMKPTALAHGPWHVFGYVKDMQPQDEFINFVIGGEWREYLDLPSRFENMKSEALESQIVSPRSKADPSQSQSQTLPLHHVSFWGEKEA